MTAFDAVEAALDGVLERRWYTNHGPMAQCLEARLAAHHGAAHAVIATNPAIGLLMLAEGLALQGSVMLSPGAPPACAQALGWAGLTVECRDPDPVGNPGEAIGAGAVLLTRQDDSAALIRLASVHGLPVLRYGVTGGPGPLLVELPTGGPCAIAAIITDDDPLATRLRNIRGSYGIDATVAVRRTANGRVSEIQAAMALIHLGYADEATS